MVELIGLLSIPVTILNSAGGVVGGIWLVILGKWSLVGYGFAATIISSRILPLALTPGLLLAVPAASALTNGKMLLGGILASFSKLWTAVVMTVWCVGSFYVFVGGYASESVGSIWPYLLWAYSIAAGPWTYAAWLDSHFSGNSLNASTMSALAACIGIIAMMGEVLITLRLSLGGLAAAFCIPIALGIVFQLRLFVLAARAVER